MMHTAEPWQYRISAGVGVIFNSDLPHGTRGPYTIARTSSRMPEANTRRICACVNALAGIPTEVVERGAFAAVPTLLQQRDELLAALRLVGLLRQLGGMLPGSQEVVQMVVEAADTAIARAEAV